MYSKNRIIPSLILILGCFGFQSIMAGTIYQWTDDAGNINYSDVPPAKSVETKTFEINIEQSATSDENSEKYSIINQVEQMSEWRRQLAEERLAKKKLHLEEKRLAYEIELELQQQNEFIAANQYQYIPRTHYYSSYQIPNHHQHRANTFAQPKPPIKAPWRNNSVSGNHGRVHF